MDDERLHRIELKIDQMSDAIVSLARMEERMITLFKRMDTYDERQTSLLDRLRSVEIAIASSSWIERGAWIVVSSILGAVVWFSR